MKSDKILQAIESECHATGYNKARENYLRLKDMRDRLLAAPAWAKERADYRPALDEVWDKIKEAEKEMCIYF